MKSDLEILKLIVDSTNGGWTSSLSNESVSLIKGKINEIPPQFYEPRIIIDSENDSRISLIEFSMKIATMDAKKRNGIMQKYHIDTYDMEKLQSIIDSIKVASEYGTLREEKLGNEEKSYGISLSNEKNIDKAYPLWIAYLYSDSKNPIHEVENRLKEDGTFDKYTPEYIVSIIDHTNSLMEGKTSSEKKDFYMRTISGILDGEVFVNKNKIDIEL